MDYVAKECIEEFGVQSLMINFGDLEVFTKKRTGARGLGLTSSFIDIERDSKMRQKPFEIDTKLLNKWERENSFDIEMKPIAIKNFIDR